MKTESHFSTFPQPLFCGNARIAAIVEILSGLPQLLEKLFEFFTILWKSLRLSHIHTKHIIFLYIKFVKVYAYSTRKIIRLLTAKRTKFKISHILTAESLTNHCRFNKV